MFCAKQWNRSLGSGEIYRYRDPENRRFNPMASDKEQLNFAVDQMSGAGDITFKYMFGEYGIYCDGKIVALFCDNQLFVKPTEAGRTYIEKVVEAPAYPGAKPYFLITDRIDDRDWLSELIRCTAQELPPPKKKKDGKSGKRKNSK